MTAGLHPKVAASTAASALVTLLAGISSGKLTGATAAAAAVTLAQFVAGYAARPTPKPKPTPAPHPGPPPRPLPRIPLMRFKMYDAIDATKLPKGRGSWAVAGYVGGRWPTWRTIVAWYPRHRKLSIAVNAAEDADCLDVEQGDASPAQCVGWYRRQRRRGVRYPVFYCNLSTIAAVLHALASAGIHRKDIRIWIAHPDGQPHICTPKRCDPDGRWGLGGPVNATQYVFLPNVDISLCGPRFL